MVSAYTSECLYKWVCVCACVCVGGGGGGSWVAHEHKWKHNAHVHVWAACLLFPCECNASGYIIACLTIIPQNVIPKVKGLQNRTGKYSDECAKVWLSTASTITGEYAYQWNPIRSDRCIKITMGSCHCEHVTYTDVRNQLSTYPMSK